MKDFDMALLYNGEDENSFAIEPEIGKWHMDDVRNIYPVNYHKESDNITEIIGLHNINRGNAHNVFNYIKKLYSDVFPCGENGYSSGGTHFLFFGDYRFLREKEKQLMYKMLNLPLFCKIKEETLYSRYNCRHNFKYNTYMSPNSKSKFVCIKTLLHSCHESAISGYPIEFRCNNVVDERIYGYYQGIILAVKENIKFKKTSEELRKYCRSGDTKRHDIFYDIQPEDMESFTMGEKDLKVVRHNTNIILKLLKNNGFVKSADALKEYLNERGINYLT